MPPRRLGALTLLALAGCTNGLPGKDGPVDTDLGDTGQADAITMAELRPGDLRVVEFMADPDACVDDDGEYVEVLYAGDRPADIDGLVIANATDHFTLSGRRVLAPGDRVLIARSASGLSSCYGVTADVSSGLALANAGDTITLSDGDAKILDQVNLADFAVRPGVAWEQSDDDVTQWCAADAVIGATADLGSPGAANGACGEDTDLPPGPAVGVDALGAGDLLVTEFMADPNAGDETVAEYIEVRNTTSDDVDLDGLKVSDSTSTHALAGSLVLHPGARVVLARSVAGMQSTYGVTAAAANGITLNNGGGDVITLTNATTTLDSVDYTAWTVTPGVAWERDDSHPVTWCDADAPIGVTGDLGSPGAANGSCGVTDTDTTTDTDTGAAADTDTVTDTDTSTTIGVRDLTAGQLTIDEFMSDPLNCAEPDGEWVELRYHGTNPVDLRGLVLTDRSATSVTFNVTKVLTTGQRVVLYSNAVSPNCFGLTGLGYSGLSLNNGGGGDLIRIEDGTGRELDSVDYDPFNVSAGDGWQRDENDTWCASTTLLGGTDYGTPGAVNATCGVHDTGDTDVPTTPVALTAVPHLGLRVAEVMADPDHCTDPAGEYVEVLNTTATTVALDGLRLVDDGGNVSGFNTTDTVAPGARVTLYQGTAGSSCYSLSGLPYTTVNLNNSGGDTVHLTDKNGRELDAFTYTGGTLTAGVALELDDVDLTTWCDATDAIGASGDKGSPGQANGVCPP